MRMVQRANEAVRVLPKKAMATVSNVPMVTAANTPRAIAHAVSARSGS